MKKQVLKWCLFLLPLSAVVLFDQLTKAWAVRELADGTVITLIDQVLEFRYVENTGMAFGLLKDSQIFFYIATGAALIAIVFFAVRIRLTKRFVPLILLLSLMAGGAIGNLIDRIVQRYVVDFIYVSLIDFPVFNVADSFVTVSCLVLAVLFLFFYKDEELKPLLSFRKKKAGTGEPAEASKEAACPETKEEPAPEDEGSETKEQEKSEEHAGIE